ncbi:MAG: aminotransferase class III-fold pyridoxal phosphate-dependent enzyme, partial [Acidimicrobiia bacterium]
GTTLATAAMSPEEYGPQSWSARVRGTGALGDPDAAGLLANDLAAAAGALAEREEGPAMVIFDSIFSSEGIYPMPDGYLSAARDWADAAGALVVADEVQAGFGRVGSGFWGFSGQGVVPDIVTLGKPMGNGYPMGAVVTTEAIAAEFAKKWHFFSTFAGSPVAAAAGNAVLDVIDSEQLATRADLVGEYLKSGIGTLGHDAIRQVRGRGLFVGVELARPDLAHMVVQHLRANRVLIGSTGPDGNVLKIRPPLVFTERHADMVIEAVDVALTELS